MSNKLKYEACTRVTFRIANQELEGIIDSAETCAGDKPNQYSIEADGVMYHVDEYDITSVV